MDVELEHGLHDLLTNVTGDEPTVIAAGPAEVGATRAPTMP
jgi:hypothetical protein